jgi:hypothetical protein
MLYSPSLSPLFFFLQNQGLNSGPTPWATPPALFVLRIFKIGFHELTAQAGFELWCSWPLPPTWLGLQAWATGTGLNSGFCITSTFFLWTTIGKERKSWVTHHTGTCPALANVLLKVNWNFCLAAWTNFCLWHSTVSLPWDRGFQIFLFRLSLCTGIFDLENSQIFLLSHFVSFSTSVLKLLLCTACWIISSVLYCSHEL